MKIEHENSSLVRVFQELTDHFVLLFREHLRLFATEVRRDSAITFRYLVALIFFSGIALTSYGLLNCSVVFFAGWAFGLEGMAWSSLLLAATNGSFALGSIWYVTKRLAVVRLGPRIATAEFERSKTWAITRQN